MAYLSGIKILDLSQFLPGPYCTLLLADLGAEVIKVERQGAGDPARIFPPFFKKEGSFFLSLNRNKKSMTLNLRTEKGKEIFYKLSEDADVIMDGFRPGVTERLGIGYEKIKEINPGIIYGAISGFGQDGPYRDLPAHNVDYLGHAGVLGISNEPVIPQMPIADLSSATLGAFGILAALVNKERTGKGTYVDISMLDGLTSWLSIPLLGYFADGEIHRDEWKSVGEPLSYGIFKAKDGYITMGIVEAAFWKRLCETLDRKDLIEKQFAKGKEREEVIAEIRKIFSTKTKKEWLKILEETGVPCGPVNTFKEVIDDPHISHRNMIFEMDHPSEGKIKQIGFPIKFSESLEGTRTPPPLLGEHTNEILSELGYDKDEIEKMRNESIV